MAGDPFLSPDECERANIPQDPRFQASIEGSGGLSVAWHDQFLAQNPDMDASLRADIMQQREVALALETDTAAWKRHYRRAIEYPASQIFVALKGGQLHAGGRLLPTYDIEEARQLGTEGEIFDIELTLMPSDFWSLESMNFEGSAARDGTHHYCHILFETTNVLSLFPGLRQPAQNVERIGELLVVDDTSALPPKNSARGRPPYPWDPFHVEVARLLTNHELPTKKEAAIQYFQSWFAKELNVSPSRAAVGQKLTPYYDQMVRRGGQKL